MKICFTVSGWPMNSRRIGKERGDRRPRRAARPCWCRCPRRTAASPCASLSTPRLAALLRRRAHEMIFSPGATRSGFEPAVAGRSLRREVRDAVDVRHVAMRRADGDRELGVAGIVDVSGHAGRDRASARRSSATAVAGVARRDHDHHARSHEPIDLDAQRALAAGEPLGLEVVADAHVDAVDAQPPAVAVDLLNVLDRRDEIAGGRRCRCSSSTFRLRSLHAAPCRRSTRVELSKARLRRARRDARESGLTDPLPGCRRDLARDDAGDVRAVSEFVAQRARARAERAREVVWASDRLSSRFLCCLKCGCAGVDAGVDDGPDDVRAERRERGCARRRP